MTREFIDIPVFTSDGIPAAAFEARRKAMNEFYTLWRDAYMANGDSEDEVVAALNKLPDVIKRATAPLMPRAKRQPKLAIRRATA